MSEQNDVTKAIALYHGEASRVNPLARYGSSRAVRVVSDRIMRTDNSRTKLNLEEALLVAQSALATGLNPFQPQPELWSWVKVGQDGRRFLTIMRGRDGTIRLAQESAKKAGSYLMPPRYRDILDDSERARTRIQVNALAVEAEVEDYQTSSEWWKRFTLMKDAGYPPDEIDRRLGAGPPKDVGIGILTQEEMAQFDRQPGGNKMPHINRVRKRAYIEALKVRWAPRIDYEALSEGAPTDTDDYIIEGEWMEAEIAEEVEPQELAKRAEDAADVLYPEDPKPKAKPEVKRPYPPETTRQRILEFVDGFKGAQKTEKRGKDLTLVSFVAWQLNECFPGPASDKQRISVVRYVYGDKIESLNDLTGAQLKAIEKWLDPQQRDGPGAGLLPSKEARMEAASMWATYMKEKGQQELKT